MGSRSGSKRRYLKSLEYEPTTSVRTLRNSAGFSHFLVAFFGGNCWTSRSLENCGAVCIFCGVETHDWVSWRVMCLQIASCRQPGFVQSCEIYLAEEEKHHFLSGNYSWLFRFHRVILITQFIFSALWLCLNDSFSPDNTFPCYTPLNHLS